MEHFFLPLHRIFGKLKREFKSRSVIEETEGYTNIFRKYPTSIHIEDDCAVLDWKSYSYDIFKREGRLETKIKLDVSRKGLK